MHEIVFAGAAQDNPQASFVVGLIAVALGAAGVFWLIGKIR